MDDAIYALNAECGAMQDEIVRLEAENAKLRDLIFDMLVDEERGSTEESTYYEHVRLAKDLGIGWSR